MAIARITGQGLTAIALSVACLWGCIVSERMIVQHANLEVSRTMYEMRLLKSRRRAEPVSVPKPPRRVRQAVG